MDQPFAPASVLSSAQAKEGVENFGELAFREPLEVLLDSYASAPLHDMGSRLLRGSVVHSLRMRLRAQEWFRRHPEIADEQIAAPIVVVGMMRSGTTLMQRLLAADPRLTCALGWEVLEVAPPLDISWSQQDPRIAAGVAREEQTRTWMPDLFAIHPMHAGEAEEEIVFLADAFLSHVPEAYAHVPRYRSWIDTQDFTPAYAYLHRMLQLLQWQKRQRGEPVRRWVLKTPAHLGYLPELRRQFPDLHLVHLHRDPQQTIPSGALLNTTLHRMHSDAVDPARIGAEWLERMGWTSDRALAGRDGWDPAAVTDVAFGEAVADPLGQAARIYDAMGLEFTADAETAMRQWLRVRPHERSGPAYDAAAFGLTTAQINERFAAYNARFRPTDAGT